MKETKTLSTFLHSYNLLPPPKKSVSSLWWSLYLALRKHIEKKKGKKVMSVPVDFGMVVPASLCLF